MTGNDEAAFARVITALDPYLEHIVVVGGWAHRLHLHHPLARDPGFQLLRTTDMDIATPARLPVRGADLRERLRGAGLEEDFLGEDHPPITHYQLGDASGLYVEFLTPRAGGVLRRDGNSDDTATIAGVTAQKLRHLDLLLMRPFRIELSGALGYPIDPPRTVLAAAPAAFLAQKLLVLEKRRPEDAEKDILYLHDTVLLFADALDALRAEWNVLPVDATRRRRVADIAATRFDAVDDRLRGAARIASDAGRPMEADDLAERCHVGLTIVLGADSDA